MVLPESASSGSFPGVKAQLNQTPLHPSSVKQSCKQALTQCHGVHTVAVHGVLPPLLPKVSPFLKGPPGHARPTQSRSGANTDPGPNKESLHTMSRETMATPSRFCLSIYLLSNIYLYHRHASCAYLVATVYFVHVLFPAQTLPSSTT